MTLPADRLCLFASPHADDATGESARALRAAGLTLSLWPPIETPNAVAPQFDALIVIGATGEWPAPSRAALVGLLRQGWRQGATIGLFAGAADLLDSADIAPGGVPIQAAGLFIDEQPPGESTVQEMIDAMTSGPHLER